MVDHEIQNNGFEMTADLDALFDAAVDDMNEDECIKDAENVQIGEIVEVDEEELEEEIQDEEVLAMFAQIESGWAERGWDDSDQHSVPQIGKEKVEKPELPKETNKLVAAPPKEAAVLEELEDDDKVQIDIDDTFAEEQPPPAEEKEPEEEEEEECIAEAAIILEDIVEYDIDDNKDDYDNAMSALFMHNNPANDLIAMLLEPRHVTIIRVETIINSNDYQQLAVALIDMADYFQQCPSLIRSLITRDIDTTASEDILMRNESLAIRCMREYCNRMAKPYIQRVMTPAITTLLQSDLPCEINPEDHEVPEGMTREQFIEQNATNVATLVGELLDTIERAEWISDKKSPWQLRYIMWAGYTATKAKFPGSEYHSASAMFYLRLITPTIAMGGKNFGLDLDQNLVRQKRSLAVLVSKVVQNIANGIVADYKEGFLKPLNQFVESRIEKNKKFMKEMAAERPKDADISYVEISWDAQEQLSASANKLSTFVVERADLFSYENQPATPGVELEQKKALASAVAQIVEAYREPELVNTIESEDAAAIHAGKEEKDDSGTCCIIC